MAIIASGRPSVISFAQIEHLEDFLASELQDTADAREYYAFATLEDLKRSFGIHQAVVANPELFPVATIEGELRYTLEADRLREAVELLWDYELEEAFFG